MAGLKPTLKCHECKEVFPREQMIFYCSPCAKTGYNYCQACYANKIAREKFSQTVCQIFGLKAPGPRIWKERERLQLKYGYTDNTIVDCLKYIYEVENKKKLTDSLCLVTPAMVEKMMKYKRTQETRRNMFDDAMNTEFTVKYINVCENNAPRQESLDDLNTIALMDF